MRFTSAALIAVAGAPCGVTGFAPVAAFSRSFTTSLGTTSGTSKTSLSLFAAPLRHGFNCMCSACMGGDITMRHGVNCLCSACTTTGGAFAKGHSATCTCTRCSISSRTTLHMLSDDGTIQATAAPTSTTPDADASTEESSAHVAATDSSSRTSEDVPPEVSAMEGVLSEAEAHNVDRPARGSGIHKHHKPTNGKEQQQQQDNNNNRQSISELTLNSYTDATVKAITTYGAFVDIGCESDALLHVSRMSNDFVSNVKDIMNVGDVIKVRISNVDLDKKQVALSMLSEEEEANTTRSRGGGGGGSSAGSGGGGRDKQSKVRRFGGADKKAQRPIMEALVEKGFDTSKFVEGEVVNTLAFGAFVRFETSQLVEELQGELDGLVHISALTAGRAESVDSIVKVGDKVQVRVKTVDLDENKLSLSMVSTEEEDQRNDRRGGGGGGGGNRGDRGDRGGRRSTQRWSDSQMGAKDWKESMNLFMEGQAEFKNLPIIQDKRK